MIVSKHDLDSESFLLEEAVIWGRPSGLRGGEGRQERRGAGICKDGVSNGKRDLWEMSFGLPFVLDSLVESMFVHEFLKIDFALEDSESSLDNHFEISGRELWLL
mmetsp:Transcript_6754/g.7681  ORF Transcript_6754/g.7681 Transcript_6754/m.7681 type:complete len:105 (+) Transcript_6754:165-479(+)